MENELTFGEKLSNCYNRVYELMDSPLSNKKYSYSYSKKITRTILEEELYERTVIDLVMDRCDKIYNDSLKTRTKQF